MTSFSIRNHCWQRKGIQQKDMDEVMQIVNFFPLRRFAVSGFVPIEPNFMRPCRHSFRNLPVARQLLDAFHQRYAAIFGQEFQRGFQRFAVGHARRVKHFFPFGAAFSRLYIQTQDFWRQMLRGIDGRQLREDFYLGKIFIKVAMQVAHMGFGYVLSFGKNSAMAGIAFKHHPVHFFCIWNSVVGSTGKRRVFRFAERTIRYEDKTHD